MKKIFFFLCMVIGLAVVKADTMVHFEVLNGKLSIPFDKTINKYTVYLKENETTIKANYVLEKDSYTVKVVDDEEKTVYTVMENDKAIEDYYFYKNLGAEEVMVFDEVNTPINSPGVIKNLVWYVIGCCSLIIGILFKVIVIGFKKR